MVVNKHRCRTGLAGDVDIQRGTPLGNPLLMRRGECERDAVVDGYRDVLERGETVGEVAARRSPCLEIDRRAARVTRGEREAAFAAVLERMLAGERVRLVCACVPKRCHGHVIAARLRRMQRSVLED